MKKEIFTNYLKNGSHDFMRILMVSVMMLLAFVQFSYGQCPLACDNLVQVSLDERCKAVITPDMILEDMGPSPCIYTVVVFGTNGLPLPNATVTSAHIGKTLTVAVYLDNNSCWGSIYVEDKLPPTIICPPDDTVFCNQTKYVLLQPTVFDSCSGVTKHLVSDVITKYPCDSALAGKRTITYYYTDASGNHSDTCNQCVYFRKVDPLVDLVWPRDTIFGKDTILCLNDIPLPDITGVPKVAGEPLYPDWSVCKIGVTYEDQLIPVCPYTFKVLRKWTYIDWCRPSGQNVYTHYQIIKVLDERGPVVSCGLNVTISTDIWTCTGTVVLPIPTVIKECSKTTVQVGYKLVRNGDTATLDGTSTNGVTNLGNGFTVLPACLLD
ncbi:MAG: HYR domain-containing protein [Saprospiraceae bacterium]|nr:HYR domain-containing protein [Saprospiraceae bacterium]